MTTIMENEVNPEIQALLSAQESCNQQLQATSQWTATQIQNDARSRVVAACNSIDQAVASNSDADGSLISDARAALNQISQTSDETEEIASAARALEQQIEALIDGNSSQPT